MPERHPLVKDMAGQVFGKLTVLEWAGTDHRRYALWSCECECGNIVVLPGGDLRSGNTKSCGCTQSMPSVPMSLPDAFDARVIRTDGDACWGWRGSFMTNGYTRISQADGDKRITILGHRLSYEIHVGPIPDGLVIDHLCRNRGCTNPKHLEPVTNEENISRGWDARKEQANV